MATRADNSGGRGAAGRDGNVERAGSRRQARSGRATGSRGAGSRQVRASSRQAISRQARASSRQASSSQVPAAGRQARASNRQVRASSRQARAAGSQVRGNADSAGLRSQSGEARVRRAPNADQGQPRDEEELVSTSVRELRRADRSERLRISARRHKFRIIAIVGAIVVLLGGWAVLYHSPAFTIRHVEVNGVKHLTSEEMAQLANVPADTTLLRVDTATIESRVEQNAWVADAQISQVLPDTLVINVTERPISAIIEIPSSSGSTVKQWAISNDHIWLMPIPEAGSEASKSTSSQVYEDAESALHIVDVPYGTRAEIGKECTDDNVNNALDIVSGLTTDLAGRVAQVSAAGTAETTLILDDGVEIAFGKAEDIRDKERVILKILEENPNVAYINVRMVETPTWRGV